MHNIVIGDTLRERYKNGKAVEEWDFLGPVINECLLRVSGGRGLHLSRPCLLTGSNLFCRRFLRHSPSTIRNSQADFFFFKTEETSPLRYFWKIIRRNSDVSSFLKQTSKQTNSVWVRKYKKTSLFLLRR